MDDLKVFEGRQAHDFDKGRERIITTILVENSQTIVIHRTNFVFVLG